MRNPPLTARNYPMAEKSPERITGQRGKSLDALTLEAAANGDLHMEDLRITPAALLQQAEIARSVGRASLAENFERAAEMTRLPQDEIMRIYELLRPGRARSAAELERMAERFASEYQAHRLAAFVREAAALYERRGLFQLRF
ncbi:diol dehydratase small subunit [Oricola nitratireducens]|uniref:diol dehydratase small subunit n=1 Tax=Oricola nitratireducens TaxID=2775868 RepID=UPI001866311E|nr:diol dehydratase small subunit [Oricola nitratireducens]